MARKLPQDTSAGEVLVNKCGYRAGPSASRCMSGKIAAPLAEFKKWVVQANERAKLELENGSVCSSCAGALNPPRKGVRSARFRPDTMPPKKYWW